jgi:hypothetical protein
MPVLQKIILKYEAKQPPKPQFYPIVYHQKKNSMKKTVWVYGLIAGGIVAATMAATTLLFKNIGHSQAGMLVGYTSMLLAFSLIYVAIKNFRDQQNRGAISFGKAFKIGVGISLVASTIYVGVWLLEFYFVFPDFGDKYAAEAIAKLNASNLPKAEIAAQTDKLNSFSKMYKNPFFNACITYTEILPVGLIVSLICAALLKKKPKP